MMRSKIAASLATAAYAMAPVSALIVSQTAIAGTAGAARLGPSVDHHQHLLSPTAAAFLNEAEGGGSLETVQVPAEISALLKQRAASWNDAKALARIYTDDAIVVEEAPVTGQRAAAEHVSSRFARPYDLMPISYSGIGKNRTLVAMYSRGQGTERTNVGLTLMSLRSETPGKWRIAAETMKFPAPGSLGRVEADALIKLLDQAHIERAVIMSVAYFFESPLIPVDKKSPAKLRSENDWTAAQIARHPERLVGFCGINPLAAQALTEMERCKQQLRMAGLKLHFGNSSVDLKKPADLTQMKLIFATANRLGMPVAVHLWSGADNYGRRDAEIFLNEILPQSPDVVVQIMHMAGGGPGWTDEALEVFANAVEANDPRARNLYFDVATVADLQTPEQLELLAKRIRQIGPKRILYGSDGSFGGRNTPNQEWGTFRGMVPLTDAEFAIIRDNVAPYLR